MPCVPHSGAQGCASHHRPLHKLPHDDPHANGPASVPLDAAWCLHALLAQRLEQGARLGVVLCDLQGDYWVVIRAMFPGFGLVWPTLYGNAGMEGRWERTIAEALQQGSSKMKDS